MRLYCVVRHVVVSFLFFRQQVSSFSFHPNFGPRMPSLVSCSQKGFVERRWPLWLVATARESFTEVC